MLEPRSLAEVREIATGIVFTLERTGERLRLHTPRLPSVSIAN